MANRVISIEVGYTSTKIVEMDFRVKNPKVYKYVSVPTPQGVYEDGFLTENAEFYTSIKQAISFNKIKTKQVVCSVTSSKIATREVQLPQVKATQVQPLVEANANDYFPINLADYEIGHLVLGNSKEADGTNKLKVMVMACPKLLIDGYDRMCNVIGLHLISIDYSGNSIYQIMKNEIKEDTEMVIRVEEKASIATIISGANMVMQRNVVYGFENAVYALMNSTAFPQKTYTEAFEELKRITCIRLALSENTVMIEKEEEDTQLTEKMRAAMAEISEALSPLIGNIARVLDLYNSKNPDKPVKRISLIGVGADISGLSKLFTNELGLKTIICGNLKSIAWNHTAGDGNSGRYVTAIGAGIASVGFVNEEKKTNDLKNVNYKNVAILSGVFFLVLCATFWFLGYKNYSDEKRKNDSLKREEATYSQAVETYNTYTGVEALYNEVLTADKLTKSDNDNLISLLESLQKILPENSEVLEFTSDVEKVNFKLSCKELSDVAKVAEKLRSLDCALAVNVDAITVVEEEETEIGVAEGTEDKDKTAKSEEKKKKDTSTEDKDTDKDKDGGEEEEKDLSYEAVITVLYYGSIDKVVDYIDNAMGGDN